MDDGLMVGLDDVSSLLQPYWFYDSMLCVTALKC